jgi:hypothetical protein
VLRTGREVPFPLLKKEKKKRKRTKKKRKKERNSYLLDSNIGEIIN